MNIYPAIDLRQGKCIRLYKGDYQLQTTYYDNPLAVVEKFEAEGASWLHIIDLDGARNPQQTQHELIASLIKASRSKIQVGGGIRSQQQIEYYLNMGAARVIIGSKSIQDIKEVMTWFKTFTGERLVLALDVSMNGEPMIVTNAWQEVTEFSLNEILKSYQVVQLRHLLCTNIALDGTLSGPDFPLYQQILTDFPNIELQASGGIRSLEDVCQLREQKLSGVVVGRALYENRFTLPELLSC